MPEYETVTGTPAGEHVTHEPRTITRRDLDEGGEQQVAMMTEIRDGTFVQWSTCTACWKEVAGCKCAGGPQEPDYISRWKENRFQRSLDERPNPERELLPSLLKWLGERGYEVTQRDNPKREADETDSKPIKEDATEGAQTPTEQHIENTRTTGGNEETNDGAA